MYSCTCPCSCGAQSAWSEHQAQVAAAAAMCRGDRQLRWVRGMATEHGLDPQEFHHRYGRSASRDFDAFLARLGQAGITVEGDHRMGWRLTRPSAASIA